MGQDWPSSPEQQRSSGPLPTVEDLPHAWEGYDRAQVEAAFDAFYRHIARLDATLHTLEAVETFREEAGSLRADLRSIRAAGWSPYPRGYTLAPERTLFGSLPEAVPRIALEVVFIVAVAAVAAVAKLTTREIVLAMAGAVLVTCLVEVIAARKQRGGRGLPLPEARPEPREPARADERPGPTPAVAVVPPPLAEDGAGWAAFAEPARPESADFMGVLSEEDEEVADVVAEVPQDSIDETTEESEPPDIERTEETPPTEVAVAEVEVVVAEVVVEDADEPEAVDEPEPGPAAAPEPVAAEAAPRRRRFRRRHEEESPPEPEPAASQPQHVRVLPVTEDTLPPWERGFDDTDEIRR